MIGIEEQNPSPDEGNLRPSTSLESNGDYLEYDEKYLFELIQKAKPNWKDVNTKEWLENIRGDYTCQNQDLQD
jgi:hypothetical protein